MFHLNSILRVCTVTLHEFKSIVLNNLHNEIMAKRGVTQSINKSKHVLIDVRELNELKNYGHVPFALHVPLQELPDVLLDAAQYGRDHRRGNSAAHEDGEDESSSAVPEHDVQDDPVVEIGAPGDKQLIFFCGHGVRSQYALSIAESCGFREHCCAHFPGGFSEYNQDPVTKEEVDQFVKEKEGKCDKK